MNSCSDKNLIEFSYEKRLVCLHANGHLGTNKSGQQAPKRSEGHLLAVPDKQGDKQRCGEGEVSNERLV